MVVDSRNGRDMGILVRATVNLPGLPAGYQAMVDPARYTIAKLIAAEYLVPIEPWESDAQTNTTAVPVHGTVLPTGTEVEGTDGDSAQESDVPDGTPAVEEV